MQKLSLVHALIKKPSPFTIMNPKKLVVHNAELTWFQFHFDTKSYRRPVHKASFDTIGARIGRLFAPESVFEFKVRWEIDFWAGLHGIWVKRQFWGTFIRLFWSK